MSILDNKELIDDIKCLYSEGIGVETIVDGLSDKEDYRDMYQVVSLVCAGIDKENRIWN